MPKLETLGLSHMENLEEKLLKLNLTDCFPLRTINISYNRLNYLNKWLMDTFDALQRRTGNLTIDLTGNPFHCYCHEHHTSTMYWMRHTDVTAGMAPRFRPNPVSP